MKMLSTTGVQRERENKTYTFLSSSSFRHLYYLAFFYT